MGWLGETEQRWDEKRTPAWCEGLPRIAFLGQEGEQKAEGGRERAAQISYRKGETLPVHPPGRTTPPSTRPPEPLVSINTTACSPSKRQTPAVADLRLLLIKGSSWRAATTLTLSPFNALLATNLPTPPHIPLPEWP